MSEKEIIKYIFKLNNNKASETIFTRSIGGNVEIAKVWEHSPRVSDEIHCQNSYNFFFIKDETGRYIGAVYDMGNDLHWLILKDSRKKGYLTNALKKYILPYIFQVNEIHDLKISISKGLESKNYNDSKKVAEGLGFRPLNEERTKFKLNQEEFKFVNNDFSGINKNITDERFLILQKRIHYAARILQKVNDELLMSLDEDLLEEISHEVSYLANKIDSISYK